MKASGDGERSELGGVVVADGRLLYHVHDTPIISDVLFDRLAKVMQASCDDITHQHKRLITLAHLKAGSLFDLKPEDDPLMCRAGLHIWSRAPGASCSKSRTDECNQLHHDDYSQAFEAGRA